ncbi:MAG: hypothetical protein IJA44_06880 [Clostridia bacterium]|nr:hypothetical protein [Clostridia bacterium]
MKKSKLFILIISILLCLLLCSCGDITNKFWGYVSNEEFSVGCTENTVYLYDKDNTQIAKFSDMDYCSTPMISPSGELFVVKSTEGKFAVYSLESFSLIKKFSTSKINFSQDDGFCFSPDGKFLINIERQKDDLHSAISVYDTTDFSLVEQVFIDENMMIDHIEFDEATNAYYVLGFMRDKDLIFTNGFVATLKDYQIKNTVKISEEDYGFYQSYKDLELMGFTKKAHKWSYMDQSLEELKNMKLTLKDLYDKYNK